MTTIGLPKEIKSQEYRVGLTPGAVQVLVAKGHQVMVETGAGLGSGYSDREYQEAGAVLTDDPKKVYGQTLIIKVKEPQPSEYSYLQPDSILFTYLHLAADETLTKALMQSQACCVAYETVQTDNGQLPLLAPMSRIAGRLATQYGAHFLTKHQGGRGVLLGGIAGVAPGRVVILGGGVVGTESAKVALGMGAQVTILDVNLSRLAELENILQGRAELRYSRADQIEEAVLTADLVIGAVLVPGAKAPVLIPKDLVAQMRPYAVLIDVAVDQGGCIETIRLTSHDRPTYLLDHVLHCGIPNLPGAVARSATQALVNATFPYGLALANQGRKAIEADPVLAKGVNVDRGQLIHPQVRHAFPHLG